MKLSPLPTILALLLLAGPATAGLVIDLETRDLGRGVASEASPELLQLVIGGRHLRMDSPARGRRGGGDTMLFDGEKGVMYVIDNERRTYLRMDRERVQAMGSQLSSAMSQVQAHLAQLPPEQRKMAEQMMKSRLPAAGAAAAPLEIRQTAETAIKEGHPCRKVEVFRGGEKIRVHWVSDGSELGISKDELGVFEDMSRFMGDIVESFGAQQKMTNPMEGLEQLGGFPVASTDFEGGVPVRETTLTGVSHRDVSAAEMSLPPGTTEQKMPAMRPPG